MSTDWQESTPVRVTKADVVHKPVASTYGKHGAPHRGRINRSAPKGRGIPAQCFVVWDDGDQTWELKRDLV